MRYTLNPLSKFSFLFLLLLITIPDLFCLISPTFLNLPLPCTGIKIPVLYKLKRILLMSINLFLIEDATVTHFSEQGRKK